LQILVADDEDMIMPLMNGRETFRLLKEINPDIKAVLSSGYSLNEQAQSVIADGIAGIIQKPFTQVQFVSLIDDVFL